MSLGTFVSDFGEPEILHRLGGEGTGVFLVEDGVFHAAVKENGYPSKLLDMDAKFYALSEDVRSRGFSEDEVDSKVKLVTYPDLVDLIMSDYEKLVWL